MSMPPLAGRLAGWTARVLFVAFAFWVLSEGHASAWAFGVPVAATVLVIRRAVAGAPAAPLRPGGLARFVAVFMYGLVRGGIDVAWRALSPRLPLSPGWMMHDIRLSGDAARRLLMMVISVMPGSLSVSVEGEKLRLHVLVTTDGASRRRIAALEDSIARAFGEDLRKAG